MPAALHVIVGQLKQYLGVDRVRLLDVPCGDLQWMGRFLQSRTDVEYTGMDIVGEVIDHHRKMFSDRPWKFLNVDIVSEPIDVTEYDLIMMRITDVKTFLHFYHLIKNALLTFCFILQ